MTTRSDPTPEIIDELRRNLQRLKLHAMLAHLDTAVERAAALEQGYLTFFAGLVEEEVLVRHDATSERRMGSAKFPFVRTFEHFDWAFQPTLNVPLVRDLQTLHFIKQGRAVLLLGRPGTGKTHLSIALGTLAASRGHTVRFFAAPALLAELYASLADSSTDRLITRLARVDLLIIDDIRHMAVKREHAALLFDLIEARHLRKSTIVSSNLSVKEWGAVLGNPSLTASMVDRLMEKAHVINIRKGRSYRTEGPESPPDRPTELPSEEEPD